MQKMCRAKCEDGYVHLKMVVCENVKMCVNVVKCGAELKLNLN